MAKRKIIEIDRDKCDGCGLCTTACAEGALELDAENKAVLVREIFCDGLGACLDVCPTDALKVIERESEEYDSKAAFSHVLKQRGAEAASRVHGIGGGDAHAGHSGCPGSLARDIPCGPAVAEDGPAASVKSRLSQWPIQLHLISPPSPLLREKRPARRRRLHSLRPRRVPRRPSKGQEACHRLPQARRHPGLCRKAGRTHQAEQP